jgi:hypothetical protein
MKLEFLTGVIGILNEVGPLSATSQRCLTFFATNIQPRVDPVDVSIRTQ